MNITHIAIWTKDLEKMKSFYETYFGGHSNTQYVNAAKQFSSYFVDFDSGTRLELMQMPSIPDTTNDPQRQFTGFIHLAFSVGSETQVNALTERLRADGFRVVDNPRHTGDGYYESVVFDPENNRIEITV